MDVIKLDVPLFLRLLEMSRELVKNDEDLHDITEIVTRLSKNEVLTMKHLPMIKKFMLSQGTEDELDQIKMLGGMK